MDVNIIATGSSGNAVVINNTILIDCGVPFKSLLEVYKDIKLILLTHEHSDHFNKNTIRRLAYKRPTLRIGCCEWLKDKLMEIGISKRRIDVYECDSKYDYGAFSISPVLLYHDVPNCGYRLYLNGEKGIYITDTATTQGISAQDYDLYMIEANYDEEEVAQRIKEKELSGEFVYEYRKRNSHLSLQKAEDFIGSNIGYKGRYIYLHGEKTSNF